MLLKHSAMPDFMNSYASLDFPLNDILDPKNFSGDSAIDLISRSVSLKAISFDDPEQMDRDLHLLGSRIRFIEEANFSMFLMMR